MAAIPSARPAGDEAREAPVSGTRSSLVASLQDCLVGLAIAALEAGALVALWRIDAFSLWTAIAVHVLAVGLATAWLGWRGRSGRDVSGAQLGLLVLAATGPIGGAIASLSALVPPRPAGDRSLLEAWYVRIADATGSDSVTELADGISIGRTIDLAQPTGPSFASIMRSGDIAAQQKVLGMIARRFQPEYVPALKLALKSREPIIRVQAAAVATRIRPTLVATVEAIRARLAGSAAPPTDADLLLARAHAALALESGLLETAEQDVAKAVLADLGRRMPDPVAVLDLGTTGARTIARIRRLTPTVRREIESRLVEERRFGDLRRLRRMVTLSVGRLYTVRPMPRPAEAVGASHAKPTAAPGVAVSVAELGTVA